MTQDDLNKLYESYKHRFQDDYDNAIEDYHNELNKLNYKGVYGSAKAFGYGYDIIEQLFCLLREQGFTILQNPEFKGMDSVDFLIVKN